MARGLIKQSKWTSNCGARRQEGRRRGGRDDVWSWVSELTGAGQGEGEKTCPLGNHKTPSFSPCYNQHHHSQQHGLILTGLAGVPSAFMWLLVLHRATLKPWQWELLWLFELCIRLICCPSQPYSSLSLSDFHLMLNFLRKTQKFSNSPRRPLNIKQNNKEREKFWWK